MTKVRFTFFDMEGNPLQNMEFTLLLQRASFNEEDTGVVLPESLVVTTDVNGQAIVELWPLKAAYKIRIAPEYEDCCGKLNWSFYVPVSTEIVDAQHLFLVPPPTNVPWDEEAIQKINQAVIDSHNSAVSAENSATASEASAVRAETAAQGVEEFAEQAAASAAAAEVSNVSAGQHETAANAAKLAAEAARDQASASELGAANSATAATVSAGQASDSAVASQTYATASEAARDAALLSKNAAAASATQTAADVVTTAANVTATNTNKNLTAADVVTVTGLKDAAAASATDAAASAQAAEDALGSITGVIADGGPIDLSGGAYPAKPNVSTVWRVTVGGTVTSTPEGTITYFEGDQLNYTKDQDIFYRTATAVRVSSVAGRVGDVVLDKTDVGLANVDNTSDADKPISTAQAAAFAARTPTQSRQDTTAGRLIKVGDYGENGGGAIVMGPTSDANAITVGGTYVFNGGGVNLPDGPWYLKHFNHAVVNYSKQVIYGLLTDEAWTRTNNNNTWSVWTRLVSVVDSLTSSDPSKALSARQGKALLEMIQNNNATIVRYTYNVAAGQTTITGNSLEGIPLAYTPGVPFMVEKDGFPLWLGSDYTAANGSSITLTQALALPSQFAITVFGAFSAADHYTKAQSDFRYYQKSETYNRSETYTRAEMAAFLNTLAYNSAEPVGTIKWVPARPAILPGFAPLDGGVFSRATYPEMWSLLNANAFPIASDASWLSTPSLRGFYTTGDGSTTFRLADYNGKTSGALAAVFLRGDGVQAAAVGNIQGSSNLAHNHPLSTDPAGGTQAGSADGGTSKNNANRLQFLGNDHTAYYPLYAGTSGGSEARPNNIAGVWVIRVTRSVPAWQ